jgi:hypothetical protein
MKTSTQTHVGGNVIPKLYALASTLIGARVGAIGAKAFDIENQTVRVGLN